VGLLPPPRRVSGRREYDADASNTLRLVLAAQQAGFTLTETRALLDLLSDSRRASRRWHEMAIAKLEQLDQKIEDLHAARATLLDALDCACAGRAEACTLVTRRETPAAKPSHGSGARRSRRRATATPGRRSS
jgi:MerR family copper efflux transcriptional regulator